MSKIYAFDIDNTLTIGELPTFERSLAKPRQEIIDVVNRLYDAGNTIWLFSARGWPEFHMTVDWLQKNNVKYHNLILGKPNFTYLIDDRSLNPNNPDDLKKIKKLK